MENTSENPDDDDTTEYSSTVEKKEYEWNTKKHFKKKEQTS